MAEKINVLTVQREISDFSLVNEIDRQNDLFNFAKLAGIDRMDVLPFVRLFELYKPAPDVMAMPEILLNYMLANNKSGSFVPDIDLNINNSGNKPWEYFIPKDIPKDDIRINTPSRTLVKLGDTYLYIPIGQLMDYKIEDMRSEFDTFMFTPIRTQPFTLRCISKKDKQIPISKLVPIKIDSKELLEFIQMLKDEGIPILKNYFYVDMLYAAFTNMGLSVIYSNFLKDNESLFNRAMSQYVIRYKNALMNKKNQRLVIESKLQKKLLLSFIPKDIKYDPMWPVDKIMNLLTPEIQNYIKSAYKARQGFIESFTKNTCQHIHEYFLSRNAQTVQKRRKAYSKLRTFINTGSKDDTGWLTCKNCSFNALCPHVKVLIEAELNDTKYSDTLAKLDRFVNHNAIEHGDEVLSNYDIKYCKICSEHIPSMGDISAGSDQYRDTYKDINSKLWAYSNVIYGHLKFNPLVNVQDFAIMITNNILPILATIDTMGDSDLISVMNTYTQSGEISPKLDLYIWLFIYAYVLHMIRENIANPSPHHIKVRLATTESKTGRNVAAYAEALFSHIKTNHRGLIDYVKSDSYEDMFKRAYTLLANSNIQFAIERMYSRAYELFNFMLNSTHFHFTFDIYNMMNRDGDDMSTTTEEYEKTIESILGETMIEASKKTDVVALRDIPRVNIANEAINADVKVDISNYGKYYRSIVLRTYDIYYKWFHSTDRAFELFDPLKHYDRVGKDIKRYKYRIVSNSFRCEKDYKRRVYTHPYELTSIINKNGDVYNWDTIVYDDGTEAPRGTKLDKPKTIVDYKSSKMNILRSKTDEISARTVIDKYLYNNNIKDFFTFYEVLCPKEGIHTYDDKEVCTKCGYNKEPLPDYYEKYKDKFEAEMKIVTTDIVNTNVIDKVSTDSVDKSYVLITQSDKLITEDIAGYIKQAQQWRYNNLSILDVAKLINIRQDVMFYLGAMSGLTYKYVMNAATIDNAPKPTTKTSSQINLLYGSYLNIASLYNLIRISNNIDNLYKPIMNKYPNAIALASKLKIDGCAKYDTRIDVIKAKESPESIYLCILQSLCELIIDVTKTGSDEFYIDCGKYLIQNVLREQTAFCKAVEPDVSLIRKRKDINLQERVEYDRIYEEEYDVEDLQMFVNDADYTGYNDTLE